MNKNIRCSPQFLRKRLNTLKVRGKPAGGSADWTWPKREADPYYYLMLNGWCQSSFSKEFHFMLVYIMFVLTGSFVQADWQYESTVWSEMMVPFLSPVRTQILMSALASVAMVSGTPSCNLSSMAVAPMSWTEGYRYSVVVFKTWTQRFSEEKGLDCSKEENTSACFSVEFFFYYFSGVDVSQREAEGVKKTDG